MLDNANLEFGVMAGVFNIPLKSSGSGLNNVETFLAHTGIPRPVLDASDRYYPETRGPTTSTASNPFEGAFNLTAFDVWGLVNDHIDYRVPKASLPASTDELKRNLMSHCIRAYNGYTYGHQLAVFNTYCIVKFFAELGTSAEVPQENSNAKYYWSQSGGMTMIRSLRAADAAEFKTYVDRLSREYIQRHSYLYGTKSALRALDAQLGELEIGSQFASMAQHEDALLPFDSDQHLMKLANLCYDESGANLADWGSSGLSVGAIFRQLYQAGYLTPRGNGAVGIPNDDVFDSFKKEAESIFSASDIGDGILDPTFREIGIGTGDFVRFAHYINASLSGTVRVSKASLREDYHHGWLQAILVPLSYHGFRVNSQGNAEGGLTDLELVPTNADRSKPYVIFELKRLDDNAKTFELAMSEKHRMDVLPKAKRMCELAMSQIHDRYKHSRFGCADGSSALYLVGLAFWRLRYRMVVSRYDPQRNEAGNLTWQINAYEDDAAKGQSTSSVKIEVCQGALVAQNIFVKP
ncbi:hypothetical protein IWW38_000416 [Coemansia aciculifera]|uniref:Uncharacterized protein n=1 Tax=Coemansia aciculifera TaxID=417176 RepID=A0ACC1M9V9_9FUNG|nr:hypothetical protein IWW38_000416 [Coemansia aciculifera]